MPQSVDFKFDSREYVIVKLFRVNYKGRVVRCIWDCGVMFEVQYIDNDGVLKRSEFYPDELDPDPNGDSL